jgi:hypothetical protein
VDTAAAQARERRGRLVIAQLLPDLRGDPAAGAAACEADRSRGAYGAGSIAAVDRGSSPASTSPRWNRPDSSNYVTIPTPAPGSNYTITGITGIYIGTKPE